MKAQRSYDARRRGLRDESRSSGYACTGCGAPLPNIRNLTLCRSCRPQNRPPQRAQKPRPTSELARLIQEQRRDQRLTKQREDHSRRVR